jgi:hypothetical protein
MILAWPLILLAAAALVWARHAQPGGHGRSWFLVWGLAGFLMSFSLIAGFSIGLFLLPVAAAVVLWAALRSPHLREASGFLAGVGATAVVLVALV